MVFRVTLKVGRPVVVDAEKFVIQDGVYLFAIAAAGLVASFPVSNVLSVVTQQK